MDHKYHRKNIRKYNLKVHIVLSSTTIERYIASLVKAYIAPPTA